MGITTRTSMHEVALPIKNIDQASKNFDRKVNGTGGVDRIEGNAHLHNPKDSHTPAEGGRLVHIALVANVNNPGASARHKNAASVIAVGNGSDNGSRRVSAHSNATRCERIPLGISPRLGLT